MRRNHQYDFRLFWQGMVSFETWAVPNISELVNVFQFSFMLLSMLTVGAWNQTLQH